MVLLLYTWGNKLIKKQFMGIKPCPQCGNITEQYLERKFFTMGVFYIPLVWIPTKRYYVCENCKSGTELDKAKFRELKKQYKDMPKKDKVITAFKELEAIAPSLTEAERETGAVYEKITRNVKFSDAEAPFIREMIENYFGYAAAIAAKAQADSLNAQAESENVDTAAGEDPAVAAGSSAAEDPLKTVPAPGTQTVYDPAQTAGGQNAVTAEQLPVRKKKWGWLVAGVVQTFVMLFGLLMLFVGLGDTIFSEDIVSAIFWIVFFGIIPIGLTVLFYYLYAKS